MSGCNFGAGSWLELVLGVALTVIDLVGNLGNPRDNGS